MIRLELDWMHAGTGEDGRWHQQPLDEFKIDLARWAQEAGIEAAVTVDVGPAGGWPVVAIEGNEVAVRAFVLARYLNGQEHGPNGLEGLLEDLDLVGQL